MMLTTLVKMALSVMMVLSSGKCHANHSLIRMEKVLMSLSNWSRTAMDWTMGLS